MFLRNHSIKSRERRVIKGSWAAPSVNRFLLTLSETNGHVSHAINSLLWLRVGTHIIYI